MFSRAACPGWLRLLSLFNLLLSMAAQPAPNGEDGVSVLEVAVFWTPNAQAAGVVGSQVETWLQHANQVLLNSGARIHLRLAHASKVSYGADSRFSWPGEDGSQTDLLVRLVDPADGYLDVIHEVRDQVGADLVLLLVNATQPTSTFAAEFALRPELGLGVSAELSEVGLIRLVGRLLGCGPWKGSLAELGWVAQPGLHPDSHAHRITNGWGGVFSTLMDSGVRLPVFSNPNLTALGQPLGVAGAADNVRTLNERAPAVAGFRPPAGGARRPRISWRRPASPAVVPLGSELELELEVAPGTAALARVEVFDDPYLGPIPQGAARPLRTFTAPPYRLHLPAPRPQWRRLVARATDADGVLSQAVLEVRTPPPNDRFSQALPLQPAGERVAYRLGGTSFEPGEPPWVAGIAGSAWWTWTAPGTGTLRVDPSPLSFGYVQAVLRAFRGAELPSLTLAAEVLPGGPPLLLPVSAGETLALVLGTPVFAGPDPHAALQEMAVAFYPGISHDAFAAALPLQGDRLTVSGHTVGATGETNGPHAGWLSNAATVWWRWQADRPGFVRVQMPGRFPGMGVAVFRGTDWDLLESLGGLGSPGAAVLPVATGDTLYFAGMSPLQSPGPLEFEVELLAEAAQGQFAGREVLSGRHGTWTLGIPRAVETAAPPSVQGRVLWWEWTAPEDGRVRLFPGFNGSRLEVFTGDALTGLVKVPTAETPVGGLLLDAVGGTAYVLAASWRELPGYLYSPDHDQLLMGYLPSNDAFAQRARLSGESPVWTIPTLLGSREPDEPPMTGDSLWYSWTAPLTGRVTLEVLQAATDLYLEGTVFRGDTLSTLQLIRDRGLAFQGFAFEVEAGVEYSLALTSSLNRAALEPATLRWNFTPHLAPAHDRFADRWQLTGRQHWLDLDPTRATADPSDPVIHGVPGGINSLWIEWTIPETGIAWVSLDVHLAGVFRQQPGGELSPVAYPFPGHPPTAIGVTAGEKLLLMVGGTQPGRLKLDWRPHWENDQEALPAEIELSPGPSFTGEYVGSVQAQSGGATAAAADDLSPAGAGARTRWWTWRPPVSGLAVVAVDGALAWHVEQFRQPDSGPRERVMYRQGTNSQILLRFHADAGVEYPLAVGALGEEDGPFLLSVRLVPDGPAPGNDPFAQADLLAGTSAWVVGSHRTATAESGEPGANGRPALRSLWWRWQAPDTGMARLRVSAFSTVPEASVHSYPEGLAASPTPPRLAIWSGNGVHSLSAPPDLAEWAPQSPFDRGLQFPARAGNTYWISVDTDGVAGAEVGEFLLELEMNLGSDLLGDARQITGELAWLEGSLQGATLDAWWEGPRDDWANVWWTWTAPRDLRITLRNEGPGSFGWAILDAKRLMHQRTSWEGDPWSSPRRDLQVRAGESYFFGVFGDPDVPGSFRLKFEALPVPTNDAFAGRLPLAGERVRVGVRAENASREPGEPGHGLGLVSLPYGGTADAPSLWWSWTAPRSGTFDLTTGFDPDLVPPDAHPPAYSVVPCDLYLYSGHDLLHLVPLGRTQSSPGPGEAANRLRFAATAGTTYALAVCPLIEGERLWDDREHHLQFALQAVADNATADAARELTGTAAAFGGVVRFGDELWWRWTAPESGEFAVGYATDFSGPRLPLFPLVQVFRRDASGSLLPADPVQAAGLWSGTTETGQTWWIRVTSGADFQQPNPPRELAFDLHLTQRRTAAHNDSFAGRSRVAGAAPLLQGDNSGATREPGEPIHGGVLGRGSQWWEWTVPHGGRWWIGSHPTGVPGLGVGVYRGTSLQALAPVPRFPEGNNMRFAIEASAGEVLQIAVDNAMASEGPFQVWAHRWPAPANDDFGHPAILTGANPSWNTQWLEATAEAGEPGHLGTRARASLWWRWTATRTAVMRGQFLGGGGVNFPAFVVYRGDSLSGLTRVGDNLINGVASREFAFPVDAGTTYRIALDADPNPGLRAFLEFSTGDPPRNDAFASRIPLTGSRAQGAGSNQAATLEPGEPEIGEPQVGATLWWSWTAPASGWTTMDTEGSQCDTRLAVYRGSRWDSLQLVAMNDDAPRPPGAGSAIVSRLGFQATAGETYQIQVGSLNERGPLALTVLGPDLPPVTVSGLAPSPTGSAGSLRLRGTPGETVWIEISEDLVLWYVAESVRIPASGEAAWDFNFAGIASRFFRLRSFP